MGANSFNNLNSYKGSYNLVQALQLENSLLKTDVTKLKKQLLVMTQGVNPVQVKLNRKPFLLHPDVVEILVQEAKLTAALNRKIKKATQILDSFVGVGCEDESILSTLDTLKNKINITPAVPDAPKKNRITGINGSLKQYTQAEGN